MSSCKNKTAKFTADAPASNKASELLRAAIDGGFVGSVLTWEDIVKPKNQNNARSYTILLHTKNRATRDAALYTKMPRE